MAGPSRLNGSPTEESTGIISTKSIEAFGRKFTTTAGHLIGDPTSNPHYQNAMSDLHKQLRRPRFQRSIFSFAASSPTDLVRSRLSKSELQYRALTYLPDELLRNIPDNENTYSLFQGFRASLPPPSSIGKQHQRKFSRGRQSIEEDKSELTNLTPIGILEKEKETLTHQLEMMGIRKNMASGEIHEIDNKVSNLLSMRKILLERLAALESEEALLEHDNVENRLDDAQEMNSDINFPAKKTTSNDEPTTPGSDITDNTFMSESIYEKLDPPRNSSNRAKKHKLIQRKSMPILHEHLKPGSLIREFRAHRDTITSMDFDVPFGTLVTAALDDTVRVWDMSSGRCIGLLDGHTASVCTLQVEDNIVATGSLDATVRLWDLKNSYNESYDSRVFRDSNDNGSSLAPGALGDEESEPSAGTMRDCPLFTLEAHVDQVTALHFRGNTLVSGSADKTLRQWDLEKGRCVQTLDVMWAAAQASTTSGLMEGAWKKTGRLSTSNADFVGALQVFDAALACGTADGMVRLWDLRSGQVHRSLVGHTGPVTCLRFDDKHLVTGSLDRSIRIWDLRTGSIFDAYAYDSPVTSMMFDNRRIVTAASEDVVKVYDKLEGRHWDCGAGVNAEKEGNSSAIVERVGIMDGYLTEGRRDGVVGIWKC